ncbi:MAG: 4Fe-4S dicluster domain-containing protein [Candidatus Hodarchaeales archaeon]|jgi:carbon-monoxide dehydrogenase iron sulfur subunit
MKMIFAQPDLCTACQICSVICSIGRNGIANPKVGGITIHRDPFERYEWQAICRHCDSPPCIDACMSGSLQKDPDSGIIYNDADACVGCWSCIMVCPFGAITMDTANKKAVQCDQCRSVGTEPQCVAACPTGALAIAERK